MSSTKHGDHRSRNIGPRHRLGTSDPLDTAVGERLKIHRVQAGISQKQLGLALRVTYQQIQKYESGAHRISAANLIHAAAAIGIPVTVLFDGLASTSAPKPKPMLTRPAIALAEDFMSIADSRTRETVRHLVHVLTRGNRTSTSPEAGVDGEDGEQA